MRKLAVLLLVVIVLGGGFYYTYWNKKAGEFKQMAASWVDTVNANAKPFTKDSKLLSYESISVAGFPTSMVIEFNKPVINVPASALVREMQLQQGITTPPPYEWVEQVSYGDKITLTGNIWGDHYTITAEGDRTDKALVNNAPRHTVIGSSSTPVTCSLGVEQVKGGAPWTMQPIFTDAKTFLAIFRSMNCNAGNTSVKDAASNAPLFSFDHFSSSASNEATGNGTNHKVVFKLDAKNLKATPAFDTAVNDYMLMIYTLQGKADQMISPFPFSEYGEQNFGADVHYDGPTEAASWSDPNMSLQFDINHFDLESALNTMSLETHISSTPKDNERTMSIVFHEKADITAKGDELSKKHFAEMLATLQKNPGKTYADPGMQFFQALSAMGQPADVVGKLYPDMHSLGKMAFDIDLSVKGPNDNTRFLKQAAAQLDNFDLTATPYGIKVKGNGASTGAMMPSGEVTITCVSCDAFVTDLGNYAMRVESVIDHMKPGEPKQPFLSKNLIDSAKQFLHGISETSSGNDVVIHFVARNNGFTVSGKQLPEVLALYMTTIAPQMPQPSPAAGQPEPTPPPGALGQ